MGDLSEVMVLEAVRKHARRLTVSGGSLLVLRLLGIARKCFQRLGEKGFSEARVILNCSCPCPHLHGFVPGKLTSRMVKVQKEL